MRGFERAVPAALAAVVLCSGSARAAGDADRLCQSPDCLIVENVHSEKGRVASVGVLDTRLHLYVSVPRTTRQFTLGVYDQNDDVPGGKPSSFVLYSPDGAPVRTLDRPLAAAWSDYVINTAGRAGIWRLSVTGPEDSAAAENAPKAPAPKARNAFMVRTVGPVDLYLKPEPAARARGLRIGAPQFGGSADHRFTVQVAGDTRLRLNLLYPKSIGPGAIRFVAPAGVRSAETRTELVRDDRLNRDLAFAALDVAGEADLRGLWTLAVDGVRGGNPYGFGIDAESRVFFNRSPLMPLPLPTSVSTGGAAARLEITSPGTTNERHVAYTDRTGWGTVYLLPDSGDARATVTRGFEWTPVTVPLSAGKSVSVTLNRALRQTGWQGWYGGDTHGHTTYYDGTDTPAQMIEAARAAGLDWVVTTEHGHGPVVERAETVIAETAPLSDPPAFVVVPGMEYTSATFHANFFGAAVAGLPDASPLSALIQAGRAADSAAAPVTLSLNHPMIGKTAEGIARGLTRDIPLIELWNSAEPATTRLWWDLLNRGMRVFAQTGSDSHNRKNFEPGFRRTYVYLADAPLTPANVVRALREGRSFLSRGALLAVTVNGQRPGGAAIPDAAGILNIAIRTESVQPLDRIDVVCDGAVVNTIPGGAKTALSANVALPAGSYRWCVIQAWPAGGGPALAISNPVFIRRK